MVGYVELRTARVWVEVKPGSKAALWYWKKGQPATARQLVTNTDATAWYAPVVFDLVALEPNTTYEYAVTVDNQANKKPAVADGSFTTQDLWQWRKPAPDFSFIAGSCAYFNEPPFDRPGTPYGKDSSIFETMAKEKPLSCCGSAITGICVKLIFTAPGGYGTVPTATGHCPYCNPC
jgi:hypothetical protein